jgi:putative SOS response-associated peptidase YedK
MCNLYKSTPRDRINARHLVTLPELLYADTIAPLKPAPFVMAQGASAVGQWGMIPPNSKTRIPTGKEGRRMSTNNARTETVASSWTYRFPWQDGKRCLIPCDSYDEPYWGTGKNIWWSSVVLMVSHGRWQACGTNGRTRRQVRLSRTSPC